MAEENRRSLRYGRDDNLGGGQVFLAEAQAGLTELSSRPERTRISYFALLATNAFAALLREQHAIDQRHHTRQEIRGSVVEGPAVLLGHYSHTLVKSRRACRHESSIPNPVDPR